MKNSVDGSFYGTKDRSSSMFNHTKTSTPGPGSYRIVSEFGRYDMSHFTSKQFNSNFSSPNKRASSAMAGGRAPRP